MVQKIGEADITELEIVKPSKNLHQNAKFKKCFNDSNVPDSVSLSFPKTHSQEVDMNSGPVDAACNMSIQVQLMRALDIMPEEVKSMPDPCDKNDNGENSAYSGERGLKDLCEDVDDLYYQDGGNSSGVPHEMRMEVEENDEENMFNVPPAPKGDINIFFQYSDSHRVWVNRVSHEECEAAGNLQSLHNLIISLTCYHRLAGEESIYMKFEHYVGPAHPRFVSLPKNYQQFVQLLDQVLIFHAKGKSQKVGPYLF